MKNLRVKQITCHLLKVTKLVRGRAGIQIGVHLIPWHLLILLTSTAGVLSGGTAIPYTVFVYFLATEKISSHRSLLWETLLTAWPCPQSRRDFWQCDDAVLQAADMVSVIHLTRLHTSWITQSSDSCLLFNSLSSEDHHLPNLSVHLLPDIPLSHLTLQLWLPDNIGSLLFSYFPFPCTFLNQVHSHNIIFCLKTISNLMLGRYPKKMKPGSWKDICSPIFITTLFTIAETWKNLGIHWWMNGWRNGMYIYMYSCAQSLSHFWLFVTPWRVAHQAPLSMGFSRQEYWSGSPFPSPVYLYKEILFGLKKEGNPFICNNMDEPGGR